MRTDLSVPFAQRFQAKKLGAKWDQSRRVWYVENKENLEPFLQWMPEHLTRPHKK